MVVCIMILLQAKREALGWSRSKLARESELNASTVTWVETGRFVPYEGQLLKLQKAVRHTGDPAELLQDVADHASH